MLLSVVLIGLITSISVKLEYFATTLCGIERSVGSKFAFQLIYHNLYSKNLFSLYYTENTLRI